LYTLPGAAPNGQSLAVELSSVAAAMAVRRIAARTRTSRSAIVLAAICAVVTRRANHPELVLGMMSHNRFERHLANYVGPLAQGAFANIEIGERSFDQLVGHTWTSVLEASRHGRYDRARRTAIFDLIEHERGPAPEPGPVVQQPGLRVMVRTHRGRRIRARGHRHRAHPNRAALAPDPQLRNVDPVSRSTRSTAAYGWTGGAPTPAECRGPNSSRCT